MPEYHNIDFEHASALMDVVQKVASVSPAYMALSGVAMMELKEMNVVAQDYLNELGKERLKAEQDAAAKLNADAQAQAEADRPRTATANQLRSVTPGEPVTDDVKIVAGEANAEGGVMSQGSSAPVLRRTAVAPDLNDASKQGSG